MNVRTQAHLKDLLNTLAVTWKGCLISSGIKAGIFNLLNDDTPQSLEEIALKLQYEINKLEKWFYFAKNNELVDEKDGGFILTPKSKLVLKDSPFKDLLGFLKITDYFMEASINSNEAFRKEKSLDRLTEGKITRNYQPKVSDNLSAAMFKIFNKYKMSGGETLLDIGCGNGSFLRTFANLIPDIQITGVDSNLFAIELGKKENKKSGLSERISMVIGDAIEDMDEYEDNSYDWVTAINVFHFYPVEYREDLIDHMVRIARKAAFMTEIIIDTSPLSANADPLMALLWNDFTGFFRQTEVDELNNKIEKKYPKYSLTKYPILQGSSYLAVISKQ